MQLSFFVTAITMSLSDRNAELEKKNVSARLQLLKDESEKQKMKLQLLRDNREKQKMKFQLLRDEREKQKKEKEEKEVPIS